MLGQGSPRQILEVIRIRSRGPVVIRLGGVVRYRSALVKLTEGLV